MIYISFLLAALSLISNLREDFILRKNSLPHLLQLLRFRSLVIFTLAVLIAIEKAFETHLLLALAIASLINLAASLSLTASALKLMYLSVIRERLEALSSLSNAPSVSLPKTLPLIEPDFEKYSSTLDCLQELDDYTRSLVINGEF